MSSRNLKRGLYVIQCVFIGLALKTVNARLHDARSFSGTAGEKQEPVPFLCMVGLPVCIVQAQSKLEQCLILILISRVSRIERI